MAAEDLSKYMGESLNEMVETIVSKGGDVIKVRERFAYVRVLEMYV